MAVARITVDAERTGVVPCVRDLQFPVALILAMLDGGMSSGEILTGHPTSKRVTSSNH